MRPANEAGPALRLTASEPEISFSIQEHVMCTISHPFSQAIFCPSGGAK